MSDLYFSEFEAVTDYDFQKLSQSQSDSDGSEYQPSRESEEESSNFSESQVGCYFCVQYSNLFSTNYYGNITNKQLRTRNVHHHFKRYWLNQATGG